MTESPPVKIEMESDPRYLGCIRELILHAARQMGFVDQQAAQAAMAVDEALANVIKHGYGERPDGKIWLSVTPLGDDAVLGTGLRIVIEDEARQVDPTCIKGRDLSDIRPGGLGVHIIREVMDEVRYEKRQGAGMRLTLVKLANGRAARSAKSA